MGGGGSFTASALPSVFSDGGGRGTEGRGRPANLSAPSGGRARGRRLVGRTSAGTSDLAGLGAEGRGRGARGFDPPPSSLACGGSAAAPDTLGASRALFAAGSAPTGAGSPLPTFSSLTLLPSDRHTAADSTKREARDGARDDVLDDMPVQRSPRPGHSRRALALRVSSGDIPASLSAARDAVVRGVASTLATMRKGAPSVVSCAGNLLQGQLERPERVRRHDRGSAGGCATFV